MKLMIDARYTRLGAHDGISRYTASLLSALKDLADRSDSRLPANFELTMIISDTDQLDMLPDLPWVKISSPTSPLEPTAAWQLRRYRPDLVFSPMQTFGIGGLGRNYPLILTLHDLIYYRHPEPPSFLPAPVRLLWRLFHRVYWPQRFLLNRADAVVTVSQTSAQLMREHRLTNRPLVVVPNAPQADSIISPDQALTRLEARGKDLIYMGSFMPYKQVETLLEAMRLLPDYRLHLLSKIAPARLAQLQPLAGGNVVFHQGVSDQDYQQLLAQAGALLTASLDEGYGLPLVEAQAAGCPLVVTDIPIFSEIAPSALKAQPGSAQDFARQIRLLEDRSRARQQVLAGLEDLSRYSWEASALTLLDLAQKTLERASR